MSSLRGPNRWFGETPGGSWVLEADAMVFSNFSLLDGLRMMYD